MINCDLSGMSRKQRKAALKFRSSLFKGLRPSNARSVGRRSQAAKFLIVRKRHRGGMTIREDCQGEPHKWGVPLLLHRHILLRYPLFSLIQEAQRKKLGKKEMPHTHHGVAVGATTPPVREVSLVATSEEGSAPSTCGRFL